MNEEEFRAQVAALPPGMRFMVGHVVPLSIGVLVLFGGLLVAVEVLQTKGSSVISLFCGIAIVLSLVNLTVFRLAKRRMIGSGSDDPA